MKSNLSKINLDTMATILKSSEREFKEANKAIVLFLVFS